MASSSTTKNKTTLVHLEDLKPTHVNHHLRLRVVHVWTVSEWNNPKKIKTFETVFVDELVCTFQIIYFSLVFVIIV